MRHGAADVLHRVVDREAARHHAAGAVDVEHDLLVGILALQEEKLGDDDVGDVVVDLGAEEDDAVLEQAAEDVPVALAAVRRLDDRRVRDEVRALRSSVCDGLDAVLGALASFVLMLIALRARRRSVTVSTSSSLAGLRCRRCRRLGLLWPGHAAVGGRRLSGRAGPAVGDLRLALDENRGSCPRGSCR